MITIQGRIQDFSERGAGRKCPWARRVWPLGANFPFKFEMIKAGFQPLNPPLDLLL